MILDTERFDGMDISAYMALVESSLCFFDTYYQKEQRMRSTKSLDENGKLVIYPGSAAENYRTAYNPVTTMAALRSVLEWVLELPEN